MQLKTLISYLEEIAPLQLQEDYDNSGLLCGNLEMEISGAIICLDSTEAVIDEAIKKNCNLVIAHHPIIFKGIKKITGKNYIERTLIKALKNDIAIYSIHTNLDNVKNGVNNVIAEKLGLTNCNILLPKQNQLSKLITYCPNEHAAKVREALFIAGAGAIGNYDSCSFNTEGTGTFKANENASPFIGNKNELHFEKEQKIEVIYPNRIESTLIKALREAHPYEEVAFDCIPLSNFDPSTGSGLIGELPEPMDETAFMKYLKSKMNVGVIKHTPFLNKKIKTVALCGGSGAFLINIAKACKSDCYISADIKYHDFFDADGQMLLCDIGHFESEQFTVEFLASLVKKKFPIFAVHLTEVKTNPVNYF